jgi:glycosyltransferase involved in cell wall biosynthesis
MAACTVAIPVYNQRAFIERALDSVLEQELPGLQMLVVDNHSEDGTWEALQSYARRGVRLHRNPRNLGLFGNFNRCLELASTPFLRILSADDRLPRGCLAREIALMEARPEAVMLSTRGRFIAPSGSELGTIAAEFPPGVYDGRRIPGQWLKYYAHYRRNPLNYPSGVLLRTSALRGKVRFDGRLATAGDIDFYFRVLGYGDLIVSGDLGAYVTRHESQTHVGPNMDGTAVKEQLALIEEFGGAPGDSAGRERLRRQFGGMCLGLAIHRALSGGTRESARVHFRLARTLAAGWLAAVIGLARIVACRVAGVFLGRHAPFVPAPARPL